MTSENYGIYCNRANSPFFKVNLPNTRELFHLTSSEGRPYSRDLMDEVQTSNELEIGARIETLIAQVAMQAAQLEVIETDTFMLMEPASPEQVSIFLCMQRW
jgi:hypothetical protein